MNQKGILENSPIRVLVITNTISKKNIAGGVEVVVKHQIKGLLSLGVQVGVLATTSDKISGQDLDLGSECNVFVAKKIIKNNTATSFSFRYIWHLIKSSRTFDIYHIHLCKDFITIFSALFLKMLRKKIVIQTHGVFSRTDRFRDNFFNAAAKHVAKGVSLHFVLTGSEDAWFAKKGWRPRRLAIRNPIPTSLEVNEKTTTYDLVFLSRFQARKRPHLVVEAAGQLLQNFPNLRFRMSGLDQGEFSKCESLISSLGIQNSVELSGEVSSKEIHEILRISKLMVLPSHSEYVPMIILEALMEGTPVIVGSDCELASELQSQGLCSFADTAHEIVDAATYLLQNEDEYTRRKLIGRSWVIRNCSTKSVCSFLEFNYRHVIQNCS